MKTRTIRILLADDHPALHSALALLLETRLRAHIVGEAYSMEDLLTEMQRLRPDVVILDWELPGLPKEDRIAALHQANPSVKVVITSSRPDLDQQARSAHADAYVSKYEPPERMVRVLQSMRFHPPGRL